MMQRTHKNSPLKADGINRTKLALAITTAAAIMLMSSVVRASTPYTHDGFHLRFGVGVIAGSGSIYSEDNKVTFSGPGLLDGMQLGYHPKENLVLFFELDSLTLFSMNKTFKQDNEMRVESNKERMFTGYLAGMGVGHYIMPFNLYLSVAAGASYSEVGLDQDGIDSDMEKLGLGFSAMAGKQWWTSANCSVGLSAQLLYMATQGPDHKRFSSHTFATGLLLSLTFS